MSLRNKETNSKVNEDRSRRFTFKGTEIFLLLLAAFINKACGIADRSNELRFLGHMENTPAQIVNASCEWNDVAQCSDE
jgi:hypothetical protein